MIGAFQTNAGETASSEYFDDRIDILLHELELAIKWQRPSILLSVYDSEHVRADADLALENRLHALGQSVCHINAKTQDDASVSLMISEQADLNSVVFFVDDLRQGEGENGSGVYRTLNNRWEFFIENQARVVFWLTEKEALDLAHYAPDYWAFRHRVIEFTDSPKQEQTSSDELTSTWREIGELINTDEDTEAKIALRTALLTDLPEEAASSAKRANLSLALSMLHWRKKDYEKASEYLNTALNLAAKLQNDSFTALCYNAKAMIETDQGKNEEAIQAYQKAIELAPNQVSAWNNLGNLYKNLGQAENALAAFQKAVEQNATDVMSWNGLGEIYSALGRNDDAIYAFLKATELNPDYAPAWTGLGVLYAKEGRLEEALAAHQKALEIDCNSVNSWLVSGEIYRMKDDNENARMAYQKVLEIEPQSAPAWNELGIACCKAGACDEAIRAYTRLIEFDYDSGRLCSYLVTACENQGRLVDLIPVLKKGIKGAKDTKKKALLWNRLGYVYRRLDDYDKAVAAYQRAKELNPQIVQSKTKLPVKAKPEPVASPADGPARSAIEVGAEAVREIFSTSEPIPVSAESQAHKTDGPEPVLPGSDTEFSQWLDQLGNMPTVPTLTERDGLSEKEPAEMANAAETETVPEVPSNEDKAVLLAEAEASEDKAGNNLQKNADVKNAQIWNELGNIYVNTGAYDEAIQAFDKATKLDPFYGWPYNNLASIFFQKGLYTEAASLYQKAIRFLAETKEKALVWNRLGDTYRRLNERNNAAVAYQKAAELDPEHVSLLTRARLSLLGNRQA